ncbi:MAG TPA: HisA/HisF-related TIM barrel protein [Gemmatimonadales bacterium]|nr:HisA/HisF-related TIM barrel protein [Gemmatimonadales bacterium]
MRVIPVLDLRHGRAVWARGGVRERYAPLKSALMRGIDGDPGALVRACAALGSREVYVADLNALEGGVPQRELVGALASAAALLVDGGVRDVGELAALFEAGARRAVLALETLPSWSLLAEAVAEFGANRIVFSLDLRGGIPIAIPAHGGVNARSPLSAFERAVRAGARAVLVLDLARVGSGAGLDWALLEHVRRANLEIELLAGGGIAGMRDLERAEQAGCDAVLVGSALHNGTLDRSALVRWRRRDAHANDSR